MKQRYVVMTFSHIVPSLESGFRDWRPLRIFKHREAAEEFVAEDVAHRAVWTYSYWTKKHHL